MKPMIVIATHSGVFQADDAFAVAALRIVNPRSSIVRTRDPKDIRTADIVVDVGGVYDHSAKRYDHHQRGRAGSRAVKVNGVEYDIPYSAFGLVWKHYSSDIIETVLETWQPSPSLALLSTVREAVEFQLVVGIDAMDNGVSLPHSETTIGLTAAVAMMNPTWIEQSHKEDHTAWLFDAAFREAVQFASGVIRRVVMSAYADFMARETVREAVEYSKRNDPRIVMLDNGGLPWQDVVCAEARDARFVVFKNPEGTWMAQAVPDAPGSFGMRLALPEPWAGLRDAELARLTGIEDAVFCHPGRFICGAKTKLGALRLVNQALMGKL